MRITSVHPELVDWPAPCSAVSLEPVHPTPGTPSPCIHENGHALVREPMILTANRYERMKSSRE
eukprot:8641518-Pyramimonas_sp.AAC.1